MSMLPPEVQTTLTQLLQALSSGDNALRSQAEEQLNNDWTANRPDILLMGLVEQIQGAQDAAVFLAIFWLALWEADCFSDTFICCGPSPTNRIKESKGS